MVIYSIYLLSSTAAGSQNGQINVTVDYNNSTSSGGRPTLIFTGTSSLISSPSAVPHPSPTKSLRYGSSRDDFHSSDSTMDGSSTNTHVHTLGTSHGGPHGPLIPKATANSHMYANQRGYGGKVGYPISDLSSRDHTAASRGYFGGSYGSGAFTPKYTPDVPEGSAASKNRATIGDQPQQYSFKAELAKRYHIYNPKKYKNKTKKSSSNASFDTSTNNSLTAACSLPPDMVPVLARQIDEAWNRYMLKVEMHAPPQITPLTALLNGDDEVSDDGYDSEELLYGEHNYDDVLGYDPQTSQEQEEKLRLMHLDENGDMVYTSQRESSAGDGYRDTSGNWSTYYNYLDDSRDPSMRTSQNVPMMGESHMSADNERVSARESHNEAGRTNSSRQQGREGEWMLMEHSQAGTRAVTPATGAVTPGMRTMTPGNAAVTHPSSADHYRASGISTNRSTPQDAGFVYHPRAPVDYRPQGHYNFQVETPGDKRRTSYIFPHLNDSDYLNSRTVNGKTVRRKSKSSNKKYHIDFNKVETIKKRPEPQEDKNGPVVSGIDVSRPNNDMNSNTDDDELSELMKRMDETHRKQMEREKMRQQLERQRNPKAIIKSFNDWVSSWIFRADRKQWWIKQFYPRSSVHSMRLVRPTTRSRWFLRHDINIFWQGFQ